MSVDEKCYDVVSGAGLEPILDKRYINSKTPFTLAKEYPKDVLHAFQQHPSVPPSMKEKLGVAMGLKGGRGQASGFIMRMMAENKKKHQGQYRNPSDNDYGSTMKQFREFDYKQLANRDQDGNNESEIGASPFIQRHFGSPEAVPFVPKAQRGSEEHRIIEGETEEQRASRLQAKAEELAELAKDLLAKSAKKKKLGEFFTGIVKVKRAKKELKSLKKERTREDGLAEAQKLKDEIASYVKTLKKEWNDKWVNGITDYFSYGKRDVRTGLRDTLREWVKESIKTRFGARIAELEEFVNSREIYKIGQSYNDGDTPNRGYNYKKLSYGEAKKVYDAFMNTKEEDEEDKTQRIRGLKGVIRRIIRTKRSLKAQAKTLALPKWWDGVMCVRAWAANNKDDYIKKVSWFGKTIYYANNHKLNPFFVQNLEELPQEPSSRKAKTKKDEENVARWNDAVGKRNEQSKAVGDALLKVASHYAKWLFTIALPTKGYNLVEYQPTEETFPKTEEIETRMVGGPTAYGQQGYTYHKTGKFRPSSLRMMIGRDGEGYYPDRDKPLPLPDVLTLLLHPDGQLAWLISSKSGEARWEGLGNRMLGDRVSGDTGFSFHDKFRKVGDQFIHITSIPVDGSKYNSEVPQKVGDIVIKEVLNSQTLLGNNEPKPSKDHIGWAYPEGINQITKNLFDDLCERKEWSKTPLVSIDLTGSGRKRR